jgi:hypothetical protein
MILKIQVSIGVNGFQRMLAHDEKRTVQFEAPLSEEVKMLMGGRQKMYFHARYKGKNELAIGEIAPPQEW